MDFMLIVRYDAGQGEVQVAVESISSRTRVVKEENGSEQDAGLASVCCRRHFVDARPVSDTAPRVPSDVKRDADPKARSQALCVIGIARKDVTGWDFTRNPQQSFPGKYKQDFAGKRNETGHTASQDSPPASEASIIHA